MSLMPNISLRDILAATTLALLATQSLPAAAQGFPTRPVTLIVPFPPGGPSDALARAVALRMGKNLGRAVVIENIGGASGTIGLAKMVHATPDGYTLGFGTIQEQVNLLDRPRRLQSEKVFVQDCAFHCLSNQFEKPNSAQVNENSQWNR